MKFFLKTAEEFDSYFDDGGSVLPFANLEKASRPNKVKQDNEDCPLEGVEYLSTEAREKKQTVSE